MIANETMTVAGLSIEITRRTGQKNLYIRIHPPAGDVTISAPAEVPEDAIRHFVLRKAPEITKIRDRMASQPRQSRREYVSGEACYLWGKPYMLQVIYEGRRYRIERRPNRIVLYAPAGASEESRGRALKEWYRAEMKRVLPQILAQCENRIGVKASACRIQYMRTRWGSCNIREKRILLNLQLVHKPIECLEYVVTHELVHLLERNHTNRFRALVEKYDPDWREAKQLLNALPLDPLRDEEGEPDFQPPDTP